MKQLAKKPSKQTKPPVPVDPDEARENREIQALPYIELAAIQMVCGARAEGIDETAISSAHRAIWQRAQELAGPNPTPLARSLALTVSLCETDVRLRQALNKPLTEHIHTARDIAFNRSMKRYLAACKTLALVQRLNLPSIQVNIGQNQIVSNG